MWRLIKRPFNRFIPEHVGNPLSLIRRMLASRKRSALFAIWLTALGILLTPIDILLRNREQRTISNNQLDSNYPIIFVCGPARSGTTVTYQILSHFLPAEYITNLTTLFPRSPITATRLFRRFLSRPETLDLENYYGKTPGLLGPSEANPIWNRWVEPDRTGFRTVLSEQNATEMSRFFRAVTNLEQKATINKNNNMNVFADVVHRHLPNAYFICLRRDPPFLVQSLLAARQEIRGSIEKGYGVENTEYDSQHDADPITHVCRQVEFLDAESRRMQSIIGEDHFWIVDYENFCANPRDLIERICNDILDAKPDHALLAKMPQLKTTNRVRNAEQMRSITDCLTKLNVSFVPPIDDRASTNN